MIERLIDRIAQRVITAQNKRAFANITGADVIFNARTFSDSQSFAEKGYAQNVYVHSVISQKAGWTGSVPWKVYEVTDEKAHKEYVKKSYLQNKESKEFRKLRKKAYTETHSHPLVDTLEQPNRNQGAREYNTGLFTNKMISGEFFELGLPEAEGSKNMPVTYQLDPWDMEVEPCEDFLNPIAGYTSTKYLSQQIIPAWQILHSKYFNPLDFYRGLSPLQPAIDAILENNSLTLWMRVLAENNGYTGGVVNFPDGESIENIQAFQDELVSQKRDSNLAGIPSAIGGSGKMEYVSFGKSPSDVDALKHIQMSANQIALALKWPVELVGDSSQKTHANFQQAIRYAYQSAIIPELDDLRDERNRFHKDGLLEDGRFYIDYDLSGVEALQDEVNELYTRAIRAWQSDLLTLNQTLEMLERETVEGQMGDMRYSDLRFSQTPLPNVPDM